MSATARTQTVRRSRVRDWRVWFGIAVTAASLWYVMRDVPFREVAHAIALEATLSFLGLGLPITQPSLGLLISNGFSYMLSGKYWISFYPGIALLVTIMSINLVADQLRDVLNPRLAR